MECVVEWVEEDVVEWVVVGVVEGVVACVELRLHTHLYNYILT